jgi:hypothetical protein
MSDDTDIMEFGFDDSGHIKNVGVEKWKQEKPGKVDRACIVTFNRYHDVVLRNKAREKGEPLTNEEQAEILVKVDNKIAERLGKKPSELTDVDRLDIRSPKFWNSYTHFDEREENGGHGAGTFRCLSQWKGSTLIKGDICCKKFGEPEQRIACGIMTYPVDNKMQVDEELLLKKRYTEFYIWTLNVKKFKKVESAYAESRADNKHTIDLKIELDGDSKYQKQVITGSSSSCWSRQDFDAAMRNWILEGGLRAGKSISNHLGFKLSKEKLLEKLEGGKGGGGSRQMEASAPNTQLAAGYDDLIA